MSVTSTRLAAPLPADPRWPDAPLCAPGHAAGLACQAPDAMMVAIEAAYTAGFARFHRVACGIIGDTELGRDAVQEAFARAIRRRGDYRGDGPLEGWLWRTVINVARDHCRMNKGMIPVAECPELADHPCSAQHESVEDTVRKIVAGLPERQRLVLYLRYYVDMSYTDIGRALDIRTGTVSATLNAAHHTLRDALSVPGGEAHAHAAAGPGAADRLPRSPGRRLGNGVPGTVRRGARPTRRLAAPD